MAFAMFPIGDHSTAEGPSPAQSRPGFQASVAVVVVRQEQLGTEDAAFLVSIEGPPGLLDRLEQLHRTMAPNHAVGLVRVEEAPAELIPRLVIDGDVTYVEDGDTLRDLAGIASAFPVHLVEDGMLGAVIATGGTWDVLSAFTRSSAY